jgi:hypothetical protein
VKCRHILRATVWCGVLSLVAIAGLPRTTQALSTTDFKVFPTTFDAKDQRTKAWFIEHLARGESKHGSITVTNTSNAPITLAVYAVDATTTRDGSFAMLSEGSARTGIGAWVKLDTSSLSLAPSQSVAVPFTLSIPANAPVGDHIGGIIVQDGTPAVKKLGNGPTINVISRVGTRIYETVPGKTSPGLAITHFSVKKVSSSSAVFHVTLKNTGNTNQTPSGEITMKNALGHDMATLPLKTLGTIAPSRSASYEFTSQLQHTWTIRQQATLSVKHDGETTRSSIGFMVLRWYDFGVIVVPLVAVGALWQLKKRFKITRRP